MTTIARIAKGLLAFATLVALGVGVPWVLWHFVGWPFPHQITVSGSGNATAEQGANP